MLPSDPSFDGSIRQILWFRRKTVCFRFEAAVLDGGVVACVAGCSFSRSGPSDSFLCCRFLIALLEKAKLAREISDGKNEIPHKFLGQKI